MSQKEKIVEYLRRLDRPVSPFSVAENLKMNPSSVRARLSDLVKEGIVERPFRGYYQIAPIQGVGAFNKPPLIQNITAIVHPRPKLRKELLEAHRKNGVLFLKNNVYHHAFEFQGVLKGSEGIVRLDLQFGLKRNKITWKMRAPLGLDYNGLLISYQYVKFVIDSLDVSILEDDWVDFKSPRCFMMVNFEFIDDRIGIKLEGVNCITFRTFQGEFEKIYNKKWGIRREVRSNQPRPIQEIFALYQGGLPSFMVAQSSYDVARSIEKFTEAQKYIPVTLEKIVNGFNKMLELQYKQLDLLDKHVRDS